MIDAATQTPILPRIVPRSGRVLPLAQRAYLESFLIAVLLCWSPSKFVGYVAPFAVLAWFILRTRSRRAIRNVLIWLAVWALAVLVHMPILPTFFFPSTVIALLTYGVWIVVFSLPNYAPRSEMLWDRMLHVARWVILLQGVLGIAQAVYGATQTGSFGSSNGDHVEGTIHLALAASRSFANPIYAINMTLMLLAIFPSVLLYHKWRLTFGLGLLALVLASVVHVLLFLAFSAAVSVVLFRVPLWRRRSGLLIVAVGLMGIALVYFALGNLTTRVESFPRYTFSGDTPRGQVVRRAVTEMPDDYPFMPFIGLGPGQFSSRAGLIGTGLYFGGAENPRSLPFLSTGMSGPFQKHVADLWLDWQGLTGQGSTFEPFLSWLSIYTEWGLLSLLASVWLAVFVQVRVGASVRTYPEKIHAVVFGAGVLLIFLLGVQENYWENPQALLVGLLMWKVLYATLTKTSRRHTAAIRSQAL